MDFACVGFGIHFCLVLPGQVFSPSEAQTWFALNASWSVVGLSTVRGQMNSYPGGGSAGGERSDGAVTWLPPGSGWPRDGGISLAPVHILGLTARGCLNSCPGAGRAGWGPNSGAVAWQPAGSGRPRDGESRFHRFASCRPTSNLCRPTRQGWDPFFLPRPRTMKGSCWVLSTFGCWASNAAVECLSIE